MEIDGFDDDRWGVCLCRNSVGGSIKGEEARNGKEKESHVDAEVHFRYKNEENGASVTAKGTYGAQRNDQGQTTHKVGGELEADFPFWLKA